jgi:hypothetical protein
MPGDPALQMLSSDPFIDRFSAYLITASRPHDLASTLIFKSARISVDIDVIQSSLLTLGIARVALPVLRGWTKLAGIGSATLAVVTLAAAGADLVMQVAEMTTALRNPEGLTELELQETMEVIQKLVEPMDTLIAKVIDLLGKLGLGEKDSGELLMAAKSFVENKAKAQSSNSPLDKLKYTLGALDAFQTFMEKLPPAMKQKLLNDDWDAKRSLLDKAKPDYPHGVDYPNPPSDGPPGSGDEGNSTA